MSRKEDILGGSIHSEESDVASTSLFAGDLNLLSPERDNDCEQDNDHDNDHEHDQAKESFQLHLPDFEELVNQYDEKESSNGNASGRPPRVPPSSPERQDEDQEHAPELSFTSPRTHNISTLSVGTSSVKSQFYLSTTSQMDSEAMSATHTNDYESLFSDDSFLSVAEEMPDMSHHHNSLVSDGVISRQMQQQQQRQLSLSPRRPSSGTQEFLPVNTNGNTGTGANIQTTITSSVQGVSNMLSPAASDLLESANVVNKTRKRRGNNNNNDNVSDNNQGTPYKPRHSKLAQPKNFLKDDKKTMTYSRRIALYLARRYKWYNPKLKIDKSYSNVYDIDVEDDTLEIVVPKSNSNLEPSIEAAWVYYEHMTLPRHLTDDGEISDTNRDLSNGNGTTYSDNVNDNSNDNENQNGNDNDTSKTNRLSRNFVSTKFRESIAHMKRPLDVAVRGEDNYESELYSPITTPISQMGDFGLGVGLYFATLRAFTVLLAIAGLFNIPNMLFYMSEEYSKGQIGVDFMLKGSAVCNDYQWVPACDGCLDDIPTEVLGLPIFKQFEKDYRIQTLTQNGQTMSFVLKNMCNGAVLRVGMINLGTVILVILGMLCMAKYLIDKQEQFDIDEQTAQDYSISITNPPEDASDPEEWRDYFKNSFPECPGMHVTSCTVAVDNDKLLDCLTKRRELIEKLRDTLPDVDDVEDVKQLAKVSDRAEQEGNLIKKKFASVFGVPAMYKQLLQLNGEIKELAKEDHPVASVFVMFETEKAQRHVLEKLTVSRYNVKRNKVNALANPKYLFRGNLVLNVAEAEEPSTIRWRELNLTTKDFVVKLVNTVVVFGIIVAVAFIVKLCDNKNWAPMAIAISNVIFPQVAKLITSFERHSREEHMQVWLYFKIAFFRWVNTAVVISLIKSLPSFVLPHEDGVLMMVYQIFFAEIITSSAIQLLDPVETFKKHVLAPRARTQEHMNLHFRGTEIFLAERYTNLTKIVFLSVWYCPLYPAVLFIAAIALGLNYYVDRFSLMRTWKPQPKLGESISHYTRIFVFPVTIIVMGMVAKYSWDNFRYDGICDTGEQTTNFVGTDWKLEPNDIVDVNLDVSISDSSTYYKLCAKEHSIEQSQVVFIYSLFEYTIYGITVLTILGFALRAVKNYYHSKYQPVGDDQNIPFRHVESMIAYVPQVTSESIAYPLIACDVERIKDSDLFEWEDPLRPYEYYDLTRDAKKLLLEDGEFDESKVRFSVMEHWPYKYSNSLVESERS